MSQQQPVGLSRNWRKQAVKGRVEFLVQEDTEPTVKELLPFQEFLHHQDNYYYTHFTKEVYEKQGRETTRT